MDRDAIFKECPSGANWHALSAGERHGWAVNLIQRMLEGENSGYPGLDEWESGCLENAIRDRSCGAYSLAATSVEVALTATDRRSPNDAPRD